MVSQIISVILAIICTETITELFVHSEIFRPLREFAESHGEFTGTLFNCGYCFSVWTAVPCAFFMAPLYYPTSFWLLNWLIWTLVIHRMSNFMDDFVDKYLANTSPEENVFADADEQFGIIREGARVSQVPLEE